MGGMLRLPGSWWLILLSVLVPWKNGCLVLVESSMLQCILEGAGRPVATTVFGSVDFEFWYAVGLTESTAPDGIRIFELEHLLYSAIDETVLWCTTWEPGIPDDPTKQPVDGVAAEGSGGARRTRRRRTLRANETLTPDEKLGGQVIGPVLFTPRRADQVTDRDCPSDLSDKAERCVVVKGTMRILAYDVDRIEGAIWGIRKGVRSSIGSNVWQSRDVDGVAFLAYLGDTEEEAFQGGGAGGGFVFVTSTVQDNGGGFARLWFISPVLLIMVLFAFFIFNKNRPRRPVQEGRKDPERCLVGTGDHPKSCHRGSYHYTPNGQQYLSTVCEKCEATRREYFYYLSCAEQAGQLGHSGNGIFLAHRLGLDNPKDDLVGTIMESQPNSCIPVRPDMQTSLAVRHWGIDVHNCGSALCQRCSDRTGAPIFVKTGVPKASVPKPSKQVGAISPGRRPRSSPARAKVQQ